MQNKILKHQLYAWINLANELGVQCNLLLHIPDIADKTTRVLLEKYTPTPDEPYIGLNVAGNATRNLDVSDDYISFDMRMSGREMSVLLNHTDVLSVILPNTWAVPWMAMFTPNPGATADMGIVIEMRSPTPADTVKEPDPTPKKSDKPRPVLKVVK